jgi:hypothetical protein
MAFKNKHLKVVMFPKPKIKHDAEFLETLVWVLNAARQGRVLSYALVFDVITNGTSQPIMAASKRTGQNHLFLCGMLETLKTHVMLGRNDYDEIDDQGA